MKSTPPTLLWAVVTVASLLGVIGCGDEAAKHNDSGPALGPVSQIFENASREFGVPKRMLLAVAFKESRLNPVPQSVAYLTADNEKSLEQGQSAFGVPLKTLGLAPDKTTSADLSVQVSAYAQWVKSQVETRKLKLAASPATPGEKFDWIWLLSQIQRSGQDTRRNIQILFARELVQKMNAGDIWQDPISGEVLTLDKEATPLNADLLDGPMRDSLKLYLDESDIFPAQYFELPQTPISDNLNNPDHVVVIHCPFSLSACLELQNSQNDPGRVQLGAHYVIPPDQDFVAKPLQIAQHRASVQLTGVNGEVTAVKNAIVVMLTGYSGHYVHSKRVQTNPLWMTKWQLSKLGSIIRNVCPAIKKINPVIDVNVCLAMSAPGGVVFQYQKAREEFHWGDIPDFDENIFGAYIQTPDALAGELSFAFANEPRIFAVPAPVTFTLKFFQGATRVDLEQLQSCSDNHTIWARILSYQLRNVNSKNFEVPLFDSGANGNGEHFLRATVYGQKGELMGWDNSRVIVTGYEKDAPSNAGIKECQRNGT